MVTWGHHIFALDNLEQFRPMLCCLIWRMWFFCIYVNELKTADNAWYWPHIAFTTPSSACWCVILFSFWGSNMTLFCSFKVPAWYACWYSEMTSNPQSTQKRNTTSLSHYICLAYKIRTKKGQLYLAQVGVLRPEYRETGRGMNSGIVKLPIQFQWFDYLFGFGLKKFSSWFMLLKRPHSSKIMLNLKQLVYLVYHSYMIIIPLLNVLMQRKLLSTYEIDSETTNHGVESNKILQDDQTKDRAQLG